MLSFFFFFFPSDRLSEVVILSADDLVCIFVLFCCLDEGSCRGCSCQVGNDRSCIQVVAFLGVLTI